MVKIIMGYEQELDDQLEEKLKMTLVREDREIALCEFLEQLDYLISDNKRYWRAVSRTIFSLPDEIIYNKMRAFIKEALLEDSLSQRTRFIYKVLQ